MSSPTNNDPKPSNQLEKIEKILEGTNLPPKKRQEIVTVLASYFKGPLPPPDILREYEDIVPGCAREIMNSFQNQTNHRIAIEKCAVEGQVKQSGRGQIFGFILSVMCIGSAVVLGFYGFQIVASVLGGSTVVSLATVFVTDKISQGKQLKNKRS